MDLLLLRRWTLVIALAGALSGCAQLSPAPAVDTLVAGSAFAPQPVPSREALFALSPAMHAFVRERLRGPVRQHGLQRGLFEALSEGGHLRLDYDASHTRTAAEAFEARAGNCLSLVLMTAALARELGLGVSFQLVELPEIWTLSERFVRLNGHVNLSLEPAPRGPGAQEMGRYTIDFQPVETPWLSRVRPLTESTVVAMFFNNRAVELMEQGELDAAFAHLQAALRSEPRYLNSLNTLGVLYRRAGDLARAEGSLRLLLQHEPGNAHAAANLAALWRAQGRVDEASALERGLPPSPFADYSLGLRLAAAGDWPAALQALERQLRRSPEFHGLHVQLARVHLQLGHRRQARYHLEQAQEQAPTADLRARYQAKVQALRGSS